MPKNFHHVKGSHQQTGAEVSHLGMLSGIPQKQGHSLPYGGQYDQIATLEISESAT